MSKPSKRYFDGLRQWAATGAKHEAAKAEALEDGKRKVWHEARAEAYEQIASDLDYHEKRGEFLPESAEGMLAWYTREIITDWCAEDAIARSIVLC